MPATARRPKATPAKPKAKGKPKASVPAVPTADRVPGRAGRNTLLLTGFIDEVGPDGSPRFDWQPRSPAGQALAALAVGSTIEQAADFASIHPATIRSWIARGEGLYTEYPDGFYDPPPDLAREQQAYLAFAVIAARARTAPVVGALDAIDRARKGGVWQAAVAQLRHLPQAKPFRPTDRIEHSGPDGAPIPLAAVTVNANAVVDLARRVLDDRRAEEE